MKRHRRQKTDRAHYCILANPSATSFAQRRLDILVKAIRKKNRQFSVIQPDTATDLYERAMEIARIRIVEIGRKDTVSAPPKPIEVTALIAAGGDGTVNLVARAAMESGLPMGILPMGRYDNISRSIHGQLKTESSVERIIKGEYQLLDVLRVGDQIVIGSMGLGFVPALAEELASEKPPRFGIGWGKLGTRVAQTVKPVKMIIKADTFRFDVSPSMLNVNLLSYTLGMNLSPASLPDDSRVELIFDDKDNPADYSKYLKGLHQGGYHYGDGLNLYRSEQINLQLSKGMKLYLDGEILQLPKQSLTLRFAEEKLKLFG